MPTGTQPPLKKLRFESVEPSEAQALLRKRQEKIVKLGKEIIQGKMSYGASKEYGVRLNGEVYEVSVREAIEE